MFSIVILLMISLFSLSWYISISVNFVMLIYILLMYSHNSQYFNLSEDTAITTVGVSLMMMTLWIINIVLLSSFLDYKSDLLYLSLLNMLTACLLLTFVMKNMMALYIFIELSIVPTLVVVTGYGYQSERVQAGMYMLMYTMFGSFPMLLAMMYLFSSFNCFDLIVADTVMLVMPSSMYIMMNLAFLVKMPVYCFHMWLPKAHVEAPTSGSMILAGIMLKLGGYGVYIVYCMFYSYGVKFLLMTVSSVGVCNISMVCLYQTDLKMLIAYSSVTHMSVVLMGLLANNSISHMSSFIVMIGHGLSSSCLFFMSGIFLKYSNSRSMLMNSSFTNYSPIIVISWFMFCIANMSAPVSILFIGEISFMVGLISWSYFMGLISFLGSLLTGAYSMYLFSSVQWGKGFLDKMSNNTCGSLMEFFIIVLHLIPLNIGVSASGFY